jgi:hypothetical protein
MSKTEERTNQTVPGRTRKLPEKVMSRMGFESNFQNG